MLFLKYSLVVILVHVEYVVPVENFSDLDIKVRVFDPGLACETTGIGVSNHGSWRVKPRGMSTLGVLEQKCCCEKDGERFSEGEVIWRP